jgi:hypothetical protein
MKLPRMPGPRLRLSLLALALICGVAVRVGAQSAGATAVSAVDVATSWVFALKRADTRLLDRTSAYPLELRIQNPPCKCKDGKARAATELAALLDPLMQSADVKALEVTSSDAKEVPKAALPAWTKRFSGRLPKGGRLVQIEATGGVVHTLTFVIVVTGNQVRAVWLNAATDDGA